VAPGKMLAIGECGMNDLEKQRENAFKPIEKNSIVLDFSNCRYLGEIHAVLKESFGLPAYYGENWDALWDCLGDRFFENPNLVVEIRGYTTLPKELFDYCAPMLTLFKDICNEHPNVVFTLIS
jgi:RNAse (barnase) inhibitor barstar